MFDLISVVPPRSARERVIIFLGIAWAAMLLVLDQASKALIEQSFHLHESCSLIDGFFAVTYVTNKGAAWGILHGRGGLLLAIALAAAAAMIVFLRSLTEGYAERYWAIFTILAGVTGNSIDRIWRGAVVDFLDFNIFGYAYPAFNIADMAICCGVCVFLLSGVLRKDKAAAPPAEK